MKMNKKATFKAIMDYIDENGEWLGYPDNSSDIGFQSLDITETISIGAIPEESIVFIRERSPYTELDYGYDKDNIDEFFTQIDEFLEEAEKLVKFLNGLRGKKCCGSCGQLQD